MKNSNNNKGLSRSAEIESDKYQHVCVEEQFLSNILGNVGEEISLPITYTTSDLEKNLPGISISVHFDSSKLEFQSFDYTGKDAAGGMSFEDGMEGVIIGNAVFSKIPVKVQDDIDVNNSTDKKFTLIWADTNAKWPGEKVSLPCKLGTAKFKILVDLSSDSTIINIKEHSPTPNYSLRAQPIDIGNSASGGGNTSNLDSNVFFQKSKLIKPGAVVELDLDPLQNNDVLWFAPPECDYQFAEGKTMTKLNDGVILSPEEEGEYHLYVVNGVETSSKSEAILTVGNAKQKITIGPESWEWISFNVDVEGSKLSDVILNPVNNLYIKGVNNFSKYSETEQKWTNDFQLKNNSGYKVYNPESSTAYELEIYGQPILL